MTNDNSPFTQTPKPLTSHDSVEFDKNFDRAIKDAELRDHGREGVPMDSMPDSKIHYNEQKGMLGAQIINKDGSTVDFGGKEAIENFSKENKITDFEKKMLIDFDDLAKREIDRSNIKHTPPEILVAQQDERDKQDPFKETLTLDQATKDRLADSRARDFNDAIKTLNNSIESTSEPVQQTGQNSVVSDEMFVSGKDHVKPIIPPEVEREYLKVGDKYHFPKTPEAVAFEDFGNKLETKSNNNGVAESMVRIAAARGWDEIKVTGSETFRKEVWLEAASRGMYVKGFTPTEQDKNELAQRAKDLDANKIEKNNEPFRARENEKQKEAENKADKTNKELAQTFKDKSPSEVVNQHPELAGAVAALTVMEKQAEADGLSPQQRAIVSARLRENITNSIERGNIPEVKIREEIELKQDIKYEREAQR